MVHRARLRSDTSYHGPGGHNGAERPALPPQKVCLAVFLSVVEFPPLQKRSVPLFHPLIHSDCVFPPLQRRSVSLFHPLIHSMTVCVFPSPEEECTRQRLRLATPASSSGSTHTVSSSPSGATPKPITNKAHDPVVIMNNGRASHDVIPSVILGLFHQHPLFIRETKRSRQSLVY